MFNLEKIPQIQSIVMVKKLYLKEPDNIVNEKTKVLKIQFDNILQF